MEQKEKNKNKSIKNWWYNLTHVRSNYKKVQSSPYASLLFALKVRKFIVALLIPYIIYMCVKMVIDYSGKGFMQTFGRAVIIGVFIFLVYKIYATIPQAKKQLEYYRKYPHTINYCPSNSKEDIDDIIKKIKENRERAEKEVNEDVGKTKKTITDKRTNATKKIK